MKREQRSTTTQPAAHRPRKSNTSLVVQTTLEINAEFQKQGMSSAWQQFYAKVKQAIQNS